MMRVRLDHRNKSTMIFLIAAAVFATTKDAMFLLFIQNTGDFTIEAIPPSNPHSKTFTFDPTKVRICI